MSYSLPHLNEKAQYVESKFTKIAAKYDLFNDLITQGMHRHWKNFLIEHCNLHEGDDALDICCGTGDITQRLKNIVGEKGTIFGLDFSSGMLGVARTRSTKNGYGSVFLQGDAIELPFKNESMNAITVWYGLRNVTSLDHCLQEVLRVLKPGGRFLSLDVGKISNPLIKPFFQLYFFNIVPFIGKLLYRGEDMFDYLPHSATDYPSQEKLAEILQSAGFSDTKFFNFVFGGSTIHIASKAIY